MDMTLRGILFNPAPRNGPFSLEDLKQKIMVENSATFGVPIPRKSHKVC